MEKLILDSVPKNFPKWGAISFYDRKKDEIYVPAIMGGANEQAAMVSMCFDGISFIEEGGHVYAPLSWLEREHPKHKDFFERLRKKHRDVIGDSLNR